MILFLVDEGDILSMAPGDSLYFKQIVEPPDLESWVELYLARVNGEEDCLIELNDNEVQEFKLRLIACLEAGKNDHTLLIDLEGLRTLVKGKHHG